LSENPGDGEKRGDGFTAWGEGGEFNLFGGVSGRGVKKERVAVVEPELRGDRWLEAIEAKAREEGYREGFSRGLEESKEQMEPLRAALLAWADGLPKSLEKSLEAHLDVMADIVVDAVGRLVGESLSTREGIRNVIELAIRKRSADLSGVLLISPGMEQRLNSLDPDLRTDLSLRNISLESDPGTGLSEFSFRTEFRSSSVDPLSGVRELENLLREGIKK
jgi:hypothetical protein